MLPDATSITQAVCKLLSSSSGVGAVVNAMCAPSGDHFASVTVKSPLVSCCSAPVATSHVHIWASSRSCSTTTASSCSLARFSLFSSGGGDAMTSSVFPLGENSKPRTPPLCLVTCHGSPPSAYSNHTCGCASFSSPASIVKAMILPSGDQRVPDTLLSPRVYWRAADAGPAAGTTHRCVAVLPGLSLSMSSDETRYATRDPSGDNLGADTRATRSASALPKRRLPSLLCATALSAGAACAGMASATVHTATHAATADSTHCRGAYVIGILLLWSEPRGETTPQYAGGYMRPQGPLSAGFCVITTHAVTAQRPNVRADKTGHRKAD